MASPIIPKDLLKIVTYGGNAWAEKLGEGSTGVVYKGCLDSKNVAVKRLNLPIDHSPAQFAALQRQFRTEVLTLSSFSHPRLVRLLRTCEDTTDKCHPFSLVFELLEEGSLADRLISEKGEVAKKGSLSPLERVDAALGVAYGLAYLHGVSSGGGEGEGASQEHTPTVHRDVKSANIGFTRIGGMLYAKLLDCGLAKALNVVPGGGGGGCFSSSIFLGSPGYIAPEVANGEYTVASEIYALGVVLLELLTGRAVGSSTAVKCREGIEDQGLEYLLSHDFMDPCWPQAVKEPLAQLVSRCIQARSSRRPPHVPAVIQCLQEIRLLTIPPPPPPTTQQGENPYAGGGMALQPSTTTQSCPICYESVDESRGLWCLAEGPLSARHFTCHGCLQLHVQTHSETAAAFAHAALCDTSTGVVGVPCPSKPHCSSPPWTLENLAQHLDGPAAISFAIGMRRALVDLPALRAQREKESREKGEACLAGGLGEEEKVRRLRGVIVEEDLTLHCPRCNLAFAGWDGCAALTCRDSSCGIGFCGICLKTCGSARQTHLHVKMIHAATEPENAAAVAAADPQLYFFSSAVYNRTHGKLRVQRIASRLAGVEEKIQRQVLKELAKVDLPGVGIAVEAVMLELGLPVQLERWSEGVGGAVEATHALRETSSAVRTPGQTLGAQQRLGNSRTFKGSGPEIFFKFDRNDQHPELSVFPDGRLAVLSNQSGLTLLDTTTTTARAAAAVPKNIPGINFGSHIGFLKHNRAATLGMNNLYIWDLDTGKCRANISGGNQNYGLAVLQDGERVAVGGHGSDTTFKIFTDTEAPGKYKGEVTVLVKNTERCPLVAVSTRGVLAVANWHNIVHVFQEIKGRKGSWGVLSLEVPGSTDSNPSALAWLPDGRLAVGNSVGSVCIYSPTLKTAVPWVGGLFHTAKDDLQLEFSAGEGSVEFLGGLKDGRVVTLSRVSSKGENYVRIWSVVEREVEERGMLGLGAKKKVKRWRCTLDVVLNPAPYTLTNNIALLPSGQVACIAEDNRTVGNSLLILLWS